MFYISGNYQSFLLIFFTFFFITLLDNNVAEDQSRKREIRLQKNREAARECRRKKKEYIKCLENRVAVLENQNKALIEELKSLKELYCQTKNDWDKPPSLEHETIAVITEEKEGDIALVDQSNIHENNDDCPEVVEQFIEDEQIQPEQQQEVLVIKPCTSTATSSVIHIGEGRFLDVRKSLLLHKALVADQKQEVVVLCTKSTSSCIRPTTSATNNCEPD